MKKLITILTIMIVLVGAVFAVDPSATRAGSAGTAAIDVTAQVTATYPIYKLVVSGGAGDASSVVAPANQYAFNVVPDPALTPAAITDVSGLIVADGSAVVTFHVNQISNSRCTASYRLSVAASDLVLV